MDYSEKVIKRKDFEMYMRFIKWFNGNGAIFVKDEFGYQIKTKMSRFRTIIVAMHIDILNRDNPGLFQNGDELRIIVDEHGMVSAELFG